MNPLFEDAINNVTDFVPEVKAVRVAATALAKEKARWEQTIRWSRANARLKSGRAGNGKELRLRGQSLTQQSLDKGRR